MDIYELKKKRVQLELKLQLILMEIKNCDSVLEKSPLVLEDIESVINMEFDESIKNTETANYILKVKNEELALFKEYYKHIEATRGTLEKIKNIKLHEAILCKQCVDIAEEEQRQIKKKNKKKKANKGNKK